MKSYISPEYIIERDQDRCIRCKVCVNQCSYDTHYYDDEDDILHSRNENCMNCQRCATFCPTKAITIRKNPNNYRSNANWTQEVLTGIRNQAETGGIGSNFAGPLAAGGSNAEGRVNTAGQASPMADSSTFGPTPGGSDESGCGCRTAGADPLRSAGLAGWGVLLGLMFSRRNGKRIPGYPAPCRRGARLRR